MLRIRVFLSFDSSWNNELWDFDYDMVKLEMIMVYLIGKDCGDYKVMVSLKFVSDVVKVRELWDGM